MSLEDKIFEDFKKAMKEGDKAKSSILSFLRAGMKNLAIEKRKEKLEDSEAVNILRKEIKRHEDSIEQFKKGAREDLAEKEEKELEILKTYLPATLSDAELSAIIDAVLKEKLGSTIKDMGAIMKLVMEKTFGKADGSKVSSLVRQALTKT